jgi:hypothetical protein
MNVASLGGCLGHVVGRNALRGGADSFYIVGFRIGAIGLVNGCK